MVLKPLAKQSECGCDSNYDFSALRNIKKGEELTADYSKYAENESTDGQSIKIINAATAAEFWSLFTPETLFFRSHVIFCIKAKRITVGISLLGFCARTFPPAQRCRSLFMYSPHPQHLRN
jgi:hypothetical protein